MDLIYKYRSWIGEGWVMLADGSTSYSSEEMEVQKVWKGLYKLRILYHSDFEKGEDDIIVSKSIDGKYYGSVVATAHSNVIITEIGKDKLEIIISEIKTTTPPLAVIKIILKAK